MNNANQSFADAVQAYPEFKGLFKQFCDEAGKRLNGNDVLPDVTFYTGADGASAKLQALDRTFEISFRFLILENARWGVLQVSFPQEDKEPVRLFNLCFDRLGNVKRTPGAPKSLHTLLFHHEFVEAFVNRVADEYFFQLSAVLDLPEGA